jgi:hypothetical protein
MTFGEINFATVSRKFFRLSSKYETNPLAAASGLAYQFVREAKFFLRAGRTGNFFARRGPCAD